MIEGQLLQCPTCYDLGKKQILGRVMPNGNLMVLRFHHGTTMIQAAACSVMCGCGYQFMIEGTVVIGKYGNAIY